MKTVRFKYWIGDIIVFSFNGGAKQMAEIIALHVHENAKKVHVLTYETSSYNLTEDEIRYKLVPETAPDVPWSDETEKP